ncbi:MAG: hypothetical protein A2V93_02810 [Ignavibacteria bacterium RBG_16_34_14]|nr:MAG: hypothetical protein A2V93_02810 [Ignavibacteria bacterium RBG_16_34_14]
MLQKKNFLQTSLKGMLIILCAQCFTSISLAQGWWETKSPMPTARGYLSTCEVNGKIYAIGGAIDVTNTSSDVEEYDPATNIWTTKPSLPEPRMGQAAGIVNGKIYIFGGAISVLGAICSDVYSYDPSIDTCWNIEAHMDSARGYFSASVVNGKIYLIGGTNIPNANGLNIVEEYDPTTGFYTRKASMPTARSLFTTAVVNDKIYAIGGAETKYGPVLNKVEEYDPFTNIWTTKTGMNTLRGWLAASVLDGKIYVIGGASDTNTNPNIESVEVYDPQTDTWTVIDSMLTPRRTHSTTVVDDTIYALGGITGGWGNQGQVSDKVEAYHPQSTTSIGSDEVENPSVFLLYQNYPNPFNSTTTIKYSVPLSSNVLIKLYDIVGNEIETLINEEKPAGTYKLNWRVANLPSGVYFYKIQTGTFIDTKKMILLR